MKRKVYQTKFPHTGMTEKTFYSLHDAWSQTAAHRGLTPLSIGLSYHSLSAQIPCQVELEVVATLPPIIE